MIMKKLKQNFKIILAGLMAMSLFICLFSSALLPIIGIWTKFEPVEKIQSYSFFIFGLTFIGSRLLFKNTRDNTVNFFKSFLKKKQKIEKKDLPDADCGCKKKK